MVHDQLSRTAAREGLAPRRARWPARIALLRSFIDRFAVVIALAALVALCFSVHSFVTAQPVWPDHEVYRRSVLAWLNGEDFMPGSGPITNAGRLPWVYPPFALLPLLPFAVLPLKAGITLLFALNVVALAGTLYLVTDHAWKALSKPGAVAVAMVSTELALVLEPVSGCFSQGQINIALMGLVAADCLTRRPRWPRGMLIGLAAVIKLMPAAFVLVFLARRDFRAVATAVATAAAANVLGFVVDFEASVKYWFTQGPAASASGSPLRSNQSVMAVLARFELPTHIQTGAWVLVCAMLTAVAWVSMRRSNMPVAVVTTGVLALLVSPTSWSNHWVWIVPGMLLLAGYGVRARSPVCLAAATVTAVVTITAPFVVLSRDVEAMLSLSWLGHLRGASYVLLGISLLVLTAAGAAYGRRPPVYSRA